MFERTALITLVALSSALYSPSLNACSLPQDPVEIVIAEVGTPTALGILMNGDYGGEPTVTVAGPGGDIAGSVARLEEFNRMYVFRPTVPLEAGEYTVAVTSGPEDNATATVTVGEPATGIEVTLSPGILERPTGSVCCSTGEPEDACIGSCDNDCESCWPAGYAYSRTVDVDVSVVGAFVVTVELSPDDGDPRAAPQTMAAVTGSVAAVLRYGDRDAAQSCVDVTVTDLDGAQLTNEKHCLDAEDFPAIAEREPGAPEAVALCAAPPDDTSDPNWQRYGSLEVENNSTTGGTESAEGGCSSTGTSPASPVALMMFLLVGLRRRR